MRKTFKCLWQLICEDIYCSFCNGIDLSVAAAVFLLFLSILEICQNYLRNVSENSTPNGHHSMQLKQSKTY